MFSSFNTTSLADLAPSAPDSISDFFDCAGGKDDGMVALTTSVCLVVGGEDSRVVAASAAFSFFPCSGVERRDVAAADC